MQHIKDMTSHHLCVVKFYIVLSAFARIFWFAKVGVCLGELWLAAPLMRLYGAREQPARHDMTTPGQEISDASSR